MSSPRTRGPITTNVRCCIDCHLGFATTYGSGGWIPARAEPVIVRAFARPVGSAGRRRTCGNHNGHPSGRTALADSNFKRGFKFQTAVSHIDTTSRSRRVCASFTGSSALEVRGSRECRALGAPAAACAFYTPHALVTTVTPENTRHSPRNGFNGFLRALLGDRACLSPSPAEKLRQLDASVGASGPHGFAVREKAHSPSRHPRPPHPVPRP